MIALDAGVLIAHLDARDAHHERARELIAESGAEALGASTITLAETLVAPARAGRLDVARSALTRLEVEVLDLGENSPVRLAQLRAEAACKLPDCCVLLAAEEHDAKLASFDADLIKVAARLGISVIDNG